MDTQGHLTVKPLVLGFAPTPLKPLRRLSDLLGAEIWIKRDDCTGLAGGGNKTRKLEFLMADAIAQSADVILTSGALQSNHARQTAAAAAALGLQCELLLEEAVAREDAAYLENGNLLLDRIMGAKVLRFVRGTDMAGAVEARAATLRADGKVPYAIPPGGSNPIGSLGYVEAARELAQQGGTDFGKIFVATGSGGTHAGILQGLQAWTGARPGVIGVSVGAGAEAQITRVAGIIAGFSAFGLPAVAPEAIVVDDRQIGDGYGQPTEAGLEAIHLLARSEGILLDPVYTSKAMAGLIAEVRSGGISPSEKVLFWHTGGAQALPAYEVAFPHD